LTNCLFKENVDFRNSTFEGNVSFKESIFKSKTRFHCSIFNKSVNFQNTTFMNLVDFYLSTFNDTQKFYLTDFLDVTIFSNVTFNKQVQFLYNKISEKTFVSFENAVFNQSFDISRSNFWCRLQVWGIRTKVIPNEFWLYETNKIKKVDVELTSNSLKSIRESYRRIKQEFRNNNNNIEALRFQEYEMVLYEKELKYEEQRKTDDRIVLWLNKWSNNFGTSWVRGLKFTFIITLIFYLIFLLTISNQLYFKFDIEGIGNWLKSFFEFLNITTWNYKPFGIENYTWGYIVLFIGRMFISYGYYQTIQAFRKYGKN